ncbi:DNA-directed RNA polymerases I and III subunit RPAC1-like [Oppia nitens]|uniref:DNA-directed RNA polymerases I and III subunit RPAC1-like n=1 Tax=Oppia nitens TaxID=1686743 RepID=UPI0023DB2F2F|nr:DNA-directed RNA polymerases I and III subunit RPAC1-like [Oppia nitens]
MNPTVSSRRRYADITEHEINNTETTDYPHNYVNYDDNWHFTHFTKNFSIKIIDIKDNEIEFDIIGVNCSLANALRRILLAEVPTMAIEKVFINNNTSIFQDEFLAHRLGLIPIKADPRFFEYRQEGDIDGTPQDTIVFNLNVKCVRNKNSVQETTLPEELYDHRMVYTKDLVWEPIGNHSDIFSDNPIRPVDEDILIAKLAVGQELDIKLHCVKGIGKDHAKFSPVATASYRLLPQIELLSEIEDEDAELLKKCFSSGVIEIEKQSGKRVANVVNSRVDSGSRNVFRYPQLKDRVKMSLIKDHFIFNVESTGALQAHQLVSESFEIMIGKCRHFLGELEGYYKKCNKS